MTENLMLLTLERAKLRLDDYFKEVPAAIREKATNYHRDIDIEPLIHVVEKAMKDFEKDPVASDAWLAPRVHAALPLYRSEAADARLWHYMSVAVESLRRYTIWRWSTEKEEGQTIDIKRVLGAENRQALARLWWTAELTRNGSDYAPTVAACGLQETIQWLLDVVAFQNRFAVQAFIRFLAQRHAEKAVTGEQVRDYARNLNLLLKTVVLDAVAPDPGPDMAAIKDWVEGGPTEASLLQESLPAGPEEEPLSGDKVASVETLLSRLTTSGSHPTTEAA